MNAQTIAVDWVSRIGRCELCNDFTIGPGVVLTLGRRQPIRLCAGHTVSLLSLVDTPQVGEWYGDHLRRSLAAARGDAQPR